MSDTAALQSALAWAHKQPVTDGEEAMPPATASQLSASLSLPGCRQTHSQAIPPTLILLLPLPVPPDLQPPHHMQNTLSWNCLPASFC